MEFNEKLQQLRKNKGITQEELAEVLYVSRTTVSKWELGRGYPSIDSLKDIAIFFSVSVDDLLSSEKLLSIAKNENRRNIKKICDIFLGAADMTFISLIALPIYPKKIDGFVYSVNLLNYTQISSLNKTAFWLLFIFIILLGFLRIIFIKLKVQRFDKLLNILSFGVNIITVLLLAVSREVYALVIAFLILLIKTVYFFCLQNKF